MRLFLFVLGICVAVIGIGTRAEAQNYPWCAFYTGGAVSGGTNCGFISFEQCMETARGMGVIDLAADRRPGSACRN
jgi:hypothetical protein